MGADDARVYSDFLGEFTCLVEGEFDLFSEHGKSVKVWKYLLFYDVKFWIVMADVWWFIFFRLYFVELLSTDGFENDIRLVFIHSITIRHFSFHFSFLWLLAVQPVLDILHRSWTIAVINLLTMIVYLFQRLQTNIIKGFKTYCLIFILI